MSDDESSTANVQGLATTRSRRERKDKTSRKATLDRIRAAKSRGGKVKYEVSDIKNVYEEVDEKEYAKNVRKRQDDDWIVDDGTGGYYDDGREIFDDEQEEFSEVANAKMDVEGEKKVKRKKIKLVKSNDIKNMLNTIAGKKKQQQKSIDLQQDEILGDILQEISATPNECLSTPLRPVKLKKAKPTLPPNVSHENTTNHTLSSPNLLQKSVRPRRIVGPAPITQRENEEVITPPPKRQKIENTYEIENVTAEETKFDIVEDEHQNADIDINGIDFDDDFGSCPEKNRKMNAVQEKKQYSTGFQSLDWDQIKPQAQEVPEEVDIVIDSSKLPLTTTSDGDKVIRMYWLDAYEELFQKQGLVYLFGKVYIESAKSYVSCCIMVKNIQRHVFLLPRECNLVTGEEVVLQDVYKEFDEKIAVKYEVMKFKTKVVEKKFVFGDANIPEHSQYLEIQYPPEFPILPQDLSGDTFSHIFGTNQSALESLLIRRSIHGPCWIDIKCPQIPTQPLSWCKLDAMVNCPNNITPIQDIQAPPLVVMTISTKTLPNMKMQQNELIGIAGLVHHQFLLDKAAPKPPFQRSFCAFSKPDDCVFPFDLREALKKNKVDVEVAPTERMLLGYFLAKVQKIDPDVIIGHNIHDFDLDVILHRISACKVANWSRIGRLRRSNMPKMSAVGRYFDKAITCGRIQCDVKIASKELIRCKNYDLSSLTEQVLHKHRTEVPIESIRNMYASSEKLLWLIEHTLLDANFALSIACELNALPLAHQITNIAGNVLSRTLLGGRSERNEYLLLHAFHKKDFILPDKRTLSRNKTTKKEASYAGGLVLEPKKGFYDKYILLLDFNSLYPSIIQEYNICFTTLDRHPPPGSAVDVDSYIPDVPGTDLETGILPTEIKKLVDRRREVKKLMKNPSLTTDEYTQYNIRQQALKLTANSMYGCLGFSNSRFYAKPLAALVTRMGRETLLRTKELAQRMNLEVIYGDTDSIMINTNSNDLDHVFKLGNQVKTEVNKLYRLLEIDIDGVFKSMLLLKKKKYAALKVDRTPDGVPFTKKELKGLDIVRRDWSELAKVAGNYAVSEILSDQPRETIVENIHSKLEEIGQKTRANEYPIKVYTINKELTKDPQNYPTKHSLPHVLVALRLNSNMSKHLRSGDVVSYVICKDGSQNPATQRAYAIEEVEQNSSLTIDEEYYLSQQVHPVVMRLCEPLDGTDSARIAQCLSLDPSGYKQSMNTQKEDDEDRLLSIQATEEEKYSDCAPIKFICPDTGKCIDLKSGVFVETDPVWKPTLSLECGDGDQKSIRHYLQMFQNQVVEQIRSDIDRYYRNWLVCDDSACRYRTRLVPTIYDRQGPPCPACDRGVLHQEFSSKHLYQQICFYKLQFDVDYALRKYKQDGANSNAGMRIQEHRTSYSALMDIVDSYLQKSAYNEIKLPHLFSWMVNM